jgi:hypothetical protein
MYEINRLIKMVQEEEPVRHNDAKLLFGERVRHEVGAEGVLIDSLHDNMLTSLYNKMKGIDTELYGEKAIEDSCDELSADMVRFECACESLSSYASNESVKLYSEAKKGNSTSSDRIRRTVTWYLMFQISTLWPATPIT